MITVIIPTKNGERYIGDVLHSIFDQDFEGFEVIVVDSGSKDGTVEIAKRFPVQIIEIPPEEFDHGSTRNKMARLAKGDILVFLTQDAIPIGRGFLRKLVEPLKEKVFAATYARQIPRPHAKPLERFLREYNYGPNPLVKSMDVLPLLKIRTFHFTNVASSYREDAFWEVGGFPDPCISNEDMIIAGRLILKGYKIKYVPEARVLHSHDYRAFVQLKRYFDIAVSLSENPDIKKYVPSGSEGIKYLFKALKFLIENHEFRWIPHAFFESFFKFLGFRLGLLEKYIPAFIKKRISLHSYYWRREREVLF